MKIEILLEKIKKKYVAGMIDILTAPAWEKRKMGLTGWTVPVKVAHPPPIHRNYRHASFKS